MKRLLILALLVVATSCGVCRKGQQPAVIIRDSIQIRERIIHDTTNIEIPREVEKVITKDTVSHLENTYAVSDAAYVSGFLTHTLESRPQIIRVPVKVVVSDTTHTSSATTVQIREVEKPLSWWARLRLRAFWYLFAALAFAYRKELAIAIKWLAALL